MKKRTDVTKRPPPREQLALLQVVPAGLTEAVFKFEIDLCLRSQAAMFV